MVDLVSNEAGKVRLTLHPGQTKAWDSAARFVFIVAGAQSGKTSFGSWWLYREIERCGAGDYLAVTATYDLFKLKMLPEMRHVFCELLPGWSWLAGDRIIRSDDGDKRIILRSANSPEGLESATAKAAWLDECGQNSFGLDSWEAIQRRLAMHQGRVLGTTTPYNLGWLKTEVYDSWRAGDPNFRVIQFKSTMNPSFPLAEYERMRDKLPAWKFNMFYNGEFTRPAGMIYSDFDDIENICLDFPIPGHWPVYAGVDFGAVNTARLGLAHDPDSDIYYLFHEDLSGDKTTQQHAQDALRAFAGYSFAQATGGSKSEVQQRMDWTSAGFPISEPMIWDVESGIDRVIELIKSRRLKIFRSCRGIIDEIGRYSRELDDSGQPTEAIKDKETFHRLDALRYGVIGATVRSWLVS